MLALRLANQIKRSMTSQSEKKGGNLFAVTVESYTAAEICQLVSLFLLHKFNMLMPGREGSIGLYRGGGLAAVYNLSGPAIIRLKKVIIEVFQSHELQITTEKNLIQTDFLDVAFNLETQKFWPCQKSGDQLFYISIRSNHPFNIKKELPKWWNCGF